MIRKSQIVIILFIFYTSCVSLYEIWHVLIFETGTALFNTKFSHSILVENNNNNKSIILQK